MRPDHSSEGRRSEPSVPNGSEPRTTQIERSANDPTWKSTSSATRTGRPPVLDDGQLLTLAQDLRSRLGRVPKLEELISESGGCQRQRASRTLRRVREDMAAQSVKDHIRLPPDTEAEVRRWLNRSLEFAGRQLAATHLELEDRHEQQREADQALISELQMSLQAALEKVEDQERALSELLSATRSLERSAAQLKAERDVAHAVADDRLKVIASLGQEGRVHG